MNNIFSGKRDRIYEGVRYQNITYAGKLYPRVILASPVSHPFSALPWELFTTSESDVKKNCIILHSCNKLGPAAR